MGEYDKTSMISKGIRREPCVSEELNPRVKVIKEHEVTSVDLYKNYLLNVKLA